MIFHKVLLPKPDTRFHVFQTSEVFTRTYDKHYPTPKHLTWIPEKGPELPDSNAHLPALDYSHHGGIFYFVITHPSSLEGETACRETWAKALNVTWYSPESTFPDTVVVSAEPNTYANIFARSLKVWAHVYAEHRGYDWYVRLWPDNYVYSDRLLQLLNGYDPETPQLIGRVGRHEPYEFVGGGAGWALSRTAFEAWVQQDGNSLGGCRPPSELSSKYYFAEDVIISTCLKQAGVQLIQRGDVFLSHPPDHKDNAQVTPEHMKKVVTTHYMEPPKIYQAWRDEKLFPRYAVISIAASAQPDDYNFLVPFTVAAWKMIGWSTIIIVVGTRDECDHFVSSLEDVLRVIDTNSSFIFIESSPAQKVTVSQIARLYVATATWIGPEDVILTTDVDLLPVDRDTYDKIALSKSLTILNANCCGEFQHNSVQIPMQPMSNIVGTKRDWLLLMNISESVQLNVSHIDDWLLLHGWDRIPLTNTVKGNNDQWYLDQRVLSSRLAFTEVNVTKIKRSAADDRIDRSHPHTWPSKLGVDELKTKIDMHAWLPAFTDPGWAELSLFMKMTFTEEDIVTLNVFKEKYVLG